MANKKKSSSKQAKPKKCFFWLKILVLAALINGGYQFFKKPTEVLGLFPITGPKTLAQTWEAYEDDFVLNSNNYISAKMLAALAQAESSGDPWASPEWTFKWSLNPESLFSPASSAFGLMQITDGTLDQMQKICGSKCSSFFSRARPGSSIKLTSVYLTRTLKKNFKSHKWSEKTRLKVISVIHLCGIGVARKYVRQSFNYSGISKCGSHVTRNYVGKVLSFYKALR